MVTLNQIVFSILDTVRPDNMTNSNITEELIRFHIKNIRAQLIKQEANKGHSVDSYIVQSLGCVGLDIVDQSECCDIPTGCTLLRTSVKIPSPIEMYNRQLITRVGPINKLNESWQQIEYERVPFSSYNRITKSLIKWFTMNNNGYIYLITPDNDLLNKSIEYVNIQGVFEDPEELGTFTNCSTNSPCFTADDSFPVKEWMVPIIIEMVIRKFVIVQSNAPVDSTNDGKNNPETTITKGN